MGWDWDEGPPSVASERETENGLALTDRVLELVTLAASDPAFVLTVELIRELNRLAVSGLVSSPGEFRTEASRILGSQHTPPPAAEVPALMTELTAELASGKRKGVELAAYALWRLNWIHPFEDGNGRTARMVCYFLLCQWSGGPLPGVVTVPERIVNDKQKYYRCLEAADHACRRRRTNVSHLTGFLTRHLKGQLRDA